MKLSILLAAALVGAGCARGSDKPPGERAGQVSADNTKKNERDRGAALPTPGDQGENAADLAISQQIRKEVVKSDALSVTAKNVKIITTGGVVTLRGPVNTEGERAVIAAIAQRAPGVTRVDNQLEITAK